MTSKPSDSVVRKAAHKGFTIKLGLVEMLGDLHSTRVPNVGKEEQFKMVCPTCDEPHKTAQQYVCEEDPEHGPFSQGDCAKAKELEGGALVKVSKAQIDAAKQSKLPKNQLDLVIHRRSDLENVLIPSGNSHVFVPDGPGKNSGFGLLVEEIREHPELVFVGTVNLNNKDRTVRLDVGLDGNLLVQELEWFQDVKQIDAPAYEELTPKTKAMGDALIEGLVEDFDAADYTKEARERLSDLVGQAAAGELPDVPTVEVETQTDDLEARLEAMLAGVEKSKPAAKKAATKKAA